MLSFPIGSRTLTVPDERAWAFASGSYYEHNVDTWIGALLAAKPGAVFYDVGSNIGYYALRAAACGASRVYAFEPVSCSYAVMSANAGPGDGIVPLRLGVSEASGERAIQLFSSSGSNSLYGAEPPAGHPHRRLGEEVIELTTLDELVAAGAAPPDLIKLDIEGGELDALRGAATVLAAHRPTLIMELSEEICARAGHTSRDVLDLLSGHGYELWGLSAQAGDMNPYALPCDGVENVIAVAAGTELPDPEAVRAAHATRPRLDPLERFRAAFAQRHRRPRAGAASGVDAVDPAAGILSELAASRAHVDLVAAAGGTADGALIAAVRRHVRGVVAVESDASRGQVLARRFAADPGFRVAAPEDALAGIVAGRPNPPLIWIGRPGRNAGAVLRELSSAPVPAGTTIALPAGEDGGQLLAVAGQAFPDAVATERDGVVVIAT